MIPKTCIDCGQEILIGNRCIKHKRERDYLRNNLPSRQAYRDPMYLAQPKEGICWLCNKAGADTRDHIIPLALGGDNSPYNIRPAHRACNSGKGTALIQ